MPAISLFLLFVALAAFGVAYLDRRNKMDKTVIKAKAFVGIVCLLASILIFVFLR